MFRNRQIDLALCTAYLCGWFLRFMPGLLTGFPVNDGGMLAVMIRDLRSNGFLLPVNTSYNYFDVPFAYPPFGMYVAVFLHTQLAISEIELLRWLPPLVSTVIIPAFYWVALQIFNSKSKAVLATLLYAVLPGLSDWLVMGGGLTRSFGILFSLLAIGYIYRLFRGESHKTIVRLAILFSSLTVLSHPEVGLQTAAICFMIWAFYGRNTSGIHNAILVSFGTALLTAPWWATVLGYHGFSPFQSAIQTGIRETLFASLFHSFFSIQGRLPLVPVFVLIGMYVALRRGDFLFVLWTFLPFLIDPRNAPAVAIFPLLMLASEGLYYLNTEFIRAFSETFPKHKHVSQSLSILTQGSFAIILLYLFFVSYTIPSKLAAMSLSASDRETMEWIRKNTLPDSRFLLLTNTGNISPMTDSYQEWFPVLAERRSENTLQGMEWILGSEFFPYSQRLVALQACPDVDCLTHWLDQNNIRVDFILFQTKRTSQSLINSVQANARYHMIYRSANARIFAFDP